METQTWSNPIIRNLLNAIWQECDGDYEYYVDILVNAKFTASEIRQEFEEQLPDGIERMENHLRNYYNEKFSTNYLYVLEWRYNTRYPENDFCMITKLPETEVDTEYQVQQTSSISGFMHQSYPTLEDALAEAIITPEECIYRNISAKEVETASKYLSERRKMKTAKEYVDSFLNLYEEKKAELSKEYEKEGRDLTSEEAVQDIKEEAYYYFSGDEYYESVTFSVWLETQLGLILLEEGYVSPCEYSAAKALKEYLADADEMPSAAEDAIIKALSELADKEKNDRVKLSKVTLKGKNFLHYELKDGYGEYGGIPHEHYTLEEYLQESCEDDEDYADNLEMDIYEINSCLVESGIAPIPENFETDRELFAGRIAYYIGALCKEKYSAENYAEITMSTKFNMTFTEMYDKCRKAAWEYDFTLFELEDGSYEVDTAPLDMDARDIAAKILLASAKD